MKKWEVFQKWLPALFLAVMAAVTLWMDVFVAQNLLDGDASDFMVRGYTFFQKGNPFSNDYYLTTESRLLDIPFVFFLFFHLFSDWTLVRVCGTVLIQAVYVLSFLFVLRQAGIRRSVRCFPSASTTPESYCITSIMPCIWRRSFFCWA